MIRSRSLAAAIALLAISALTSTPVSAKTRHHQPSYPQIFTPWGDNYQSYQPFHQQTSYQQKARHRKKPRSTVDASGNRAQRTSGTAYVVSKKTGAKARVSAEYVSTFQGYVDALEARGAEVHYMGGIRPGRCSSGSQHPCGMALDVCQDYRGHVSGARNCKLPPPTEMAALARQHGLYEGSVWCRSPDYGHAQILPSGSTCTARGVAGLGRGLPTMTGKIVLASAKRKYRTANYAAAR